MAPLNKAGSSGKPLHNSVPPIDDIPVAFRDTPEQKPQSRFSRGWLIAGLVGLGVTLVAGVGFALVETQSMASRQLAQTAPGAPASESTQPQPNAGETSSVEEESLLGHKRYAEAPAAELKQVAPDGSIKMRKAAAEAFLAMQAAAQAEGISLVPISGFRTIDDQQHLFFEVKAERGQVATKRAEVSAPPGYSEHHTGYAIDIGEANVPATNVNPEFENTEAFKWLSANAPRYSFELSFPKDNPQGVSYEPWHWRFVGDSDSLETFYKGQGAK